MRRLATALQPGRLQTSLNKPPLTRSLKQHTFRHRRNTSPSEDERETHQGGGPDWFVSDANSRAGRRTVLETGRMRETDELYHFRLGDCFRLSGRVSRRRIAR